MAEALKPVFGSREPLALLRDESACTREIIASSLEAAGLGGLSGPVWQSVLALREADALTGSELQAKFVQDGASALSFGGLSMFFGGLEGVAGSPSSKVYETMAVEHTAEPAAVHRSASAFAVVLIARAVPRARARPWCLRVTSVLPDTSLRNPSPSW